MFLVVFSRLNTFSAAKIHFFPETSKLFKRFFLKSLGYGPLQRLRHLCHEDRLTKRSVERDW